MVSELKGLGVALITPFEKDGSVDFSSLQKLVKKCIKGGANYLVVLGTTGETPTLTKEEKKDILKAVVEYNEGAIPLVAGFGGNNTLEIIEDLKSFDTNGYSYILSASPYYNKPNQEGIYQHYKTIAKEAPLPIILYNVPGRTGSNMLPETTLKLAREIENIVAIKEASGNIDQCMKLVKNKPKEFIVLSGDDNLVVSQMAIGVEGCISVIGNLLPEEFSKMIHQCLNNEYDAARLTQLKLLEIIDLIFEEGNPVGIKTALHLQNICLDSVRLPLVKGSATLRERIKKAMIQI
jgi:4-hydroxy-tetrahydrodipicolinate synthase